MAKGKETEKGRGKSKQQNTSPKGKSEGKISGEGTQWKDQSFTRKRKARHHTGKVSQMDITKKGNHMRATQGTSSEADSYQSQVIFLKASDIVHKFKWWDAWPE